MRSPRSASYAHEERVASAVRHRAYCALFFLVTLLSLAGCKGEGERGTAIRLVDRFDSKMIEGSPQGAEAAPTAAWNFAVPPPEPSATNPDAKTFGWKAATGVADLKIVDGHLTGRSTSTFPVIFVTRPTAMDSNDVIYSLDVRLRVSDGANMSANSLPNAAILRMRGGDDPGAGFPWLFQSPLRAGDNFQNVSIKPSRTVGIRGMELLAIRPVDIAGATFDIESVRLVSQKEHREAIPTGVGWNGLKEIYRETIVSRSPERFRMDLDIPERSWLDLNVGTLDNDPVTFKITAQAAGGDEQVLLERTITTPHRWEFTPINLARHAGKTTLVFSLDVASDRRIGFWGSPVIRTHDPNPITQQPPAPSLGGVQAPQGVILIMCDTLRKDHLNFYGYKRDTAPNLARTASQGALFLDNVSPATWTKVASSSLLTSLYPTSHRVKDFGDHISPAATTLAEVYRSAGYATVGFSSVLFTGKFTNLHQGYEELHESTSVDDPRFESKTAREFVDRAEQWIERHGDTPFFMYLHVFDPHDPFEPREPYAAQWADPAKKQEHEKQAEEVTKVITDPLMKMFHMPSKAEMEKAGLNANDFVSYLVDWYDGSIRGMDAEIARLIQRLRAKGLEDKVQIAFVADHGEEFIEHGKTFHGHSVHSELTDVPLFLYRPGTIPSVQITETVRSIDVLPTLLDLSGLKNPKEVQGQSLVPLIVAASKQPRQAGAGAGEPAAVNGWKKMPAITEKAVTKDAGGPPPRETESYSIVLDGWKLIHNVVKSEGTPEFQLYQRADDPLDQKNVAMEHPDIVERLKGELDAWKKTATEQQLPESVDESNMSPEELQRLRSLGYIK